jgi:hypothetical protein
MNKSSKTQALRRFKHLSPSENRIVYTSRLSDDKGTILFYTLLVLCVLSLIGGISIQTTWFEITLSGNDRFINRLKIKSESAAAAAVALVENTDPAVLGKTDWETPSRPPWLSRGIDNRFDTESGGKKQKDLLEYARNTDNWINGDALPANCATFETLVKDQDNGEIPQYLEGCRFQVIDGERAQGSSLETGNRLPEMHNFYITGLSEDGVGKCMVQVGYRKMVKKQ